MRHSSTKQRQGEEVRLAPFCLQRPTQVPSIPSSMLFYICPLFADLHQAYEHL